MENTLRVELKDCESVLSASAPGRADFLNTHQDYKGLPVVPVAIKLRCYAIGGSTDSNTVRVKSVNLEEAGSEYVDEFSLDDINLKGRGWFGDYIRAVFKVFIEEGYKVKGMNIVICSEVPIGAGLSSSAALEISVAKLVSEVCKLYLDKKTIAELGYKAEHDIMRIPCGRLDQYASSFGGIIKVETRPPFYVEELKMKNLAFIISDSGEHRRITSIHPNRQMEINQALKIILDEVKPPENIARYLSYDYYETRWEHLVDILEEYLDRLPKKLADRIIFTLRTHKSTLYALDILRGKKASRERFVKVIGEDFIEKWKIDFADPLSVIGAIMNYQHILLRDFYEVSTSKLEELRKILIDAGALGAKISGAGMGGSIIALSKTVDSAEFIKRECIRRGYTSTWISEPEEGARLEKTITLR